MVSGLLGVKPPCGRSEAVSYTHLDVYKRQVINTIESNGSPLHNAFRDILNGLLSPFTNLINGIIKGINWVLDKVGGDSHKLGTFTIRCV